MIYPKTKSSFNQWVDKRMELYLMRVVATLELIGQKCVREARDRGSYQDQTGNLRSSVGYAIVRDGRIISLSDFNVVKQGVQGQNEGVNLVKKIAKEYTKGIVLIVVAGMNYAAVVETRRNVLTSSELLAEIEVPRLLNKLKV